MGHQVYITRKKNWFEKDQPHEVSLQEWFNYLESDPEMRLDGFAETKTKDGSVIRMKHESIAVWLNHSRNKAGKYFVWFSRSTSGNIMATNPDEEVLRKMFQIAFNLKAEVQGEEGEIYEANGKPK